MRNYLTRLSVLVAILVLATASAQAEIGVTDTEILIGMSNAQSGPAAGLGIGLKAGANAYIDKVNATGGVHGRKLRLISVDDGYDPARCAAMTKKLVEEDKVFALFGYVGTPTSTAAVPIAVRAETPYLFPFTGAEFLRNPPNKWVFNLRASYFDETEAMVERLTKDLGFNKIAVFIQDDAFGEAGKAGVNRALRNRNLQLAAEARFKRNTAEVEEGITKLKAAAPEAVVVVGPYYSVAAVVKKSKAAGFSPKFLTVSFVGTANLIREVGADGDGIVVTQVLPSPEDSSLAIIQQYQSDLKIGGDYTSLEGYIDAAVLVEALKKAGRNLSRPTFLSALESLEVDLGGLRVAFSAAKHQGFSQIWPTQLKGGKVIAANKF
ncbi:branched-chain amino acid transport system substrate-binding protein [Gammaproteobacteria bacterium]